MVAFMSRLRLPISVRLTFWYGLSLLLLLSVFVVFLYAGFHVSLHRDFNDQMDEVQRLLLPAIQTEGEMPVLVPSDAIRSVAYQTDGASGTYVRLLSPIGQILYQSPNFTGHQRFRPSVPTAGTEASYSHTWEGAPTRSRYTPVRDALGTLHGWLEITRLESSIHRELHRLEWLLAAGIVLGMLVAIASGYGLAKRALRPVAMLTEAANQIRVTDLERRLPADFGVRDELTDLADTFNLMLRRLQVSFERERRFRADAAHELFTPLSAMQSEIDVALHRPREASYYEQTLQAVRNHTRRMNGILDGLLQLSRAEGLEHLVLEKIDVSAFVVQRLYRFKSNAVAQQVELKHEVTPSVFTSADPGHIEAILDNLMDNAIKYTPPGGTVCMRVHRDAEEVVLSVADTGIGFTEAERAQLFNRFFRSDTPAVQRTRGSGLGLSITQALVETYGGQITASSNGPEAGSTFEVRLPVWGLKR